jgi:predicted LPLAT superfamily acyltransferase
MQKITRWRRKKESTSSFGLSLIIICYRVLGKKITSVIIWCISCLVVIFNKDLRKISADYLIRIRQYADQQCINLPANNTFKHVNSFCYSIFSRLLAWKGYLTLVDTESVNDSISRIHEAEKLDTGALIIGAHIGCLEVLRAMNSFSSKKVVNIVIVVSNSQRLVNFMKRVNFNSSLNFIIADEITPATAIDLAQRAARKEWIVILGDRMLTADTRSVSAQFLGKEALFPQGPWILAHMLKVPVYTMYAIRANRHYKVIFNSWGYCNIPRKNRDIQLSNYVQKYAKELEQILFINPCEWFNFYDFWKNND